MRPLALWLLSAALAGSAHAASARDAATVPSIADATYDQYRDQYTPSTLCAGAEVTLWRCTTGKREFALCSSRVATHTTGYLQYRAGQAGAISFAYPATQRPPSGLFRYTANANGDAAVEFKNGGYAYRLVDPLRDRSLILVQAPGASGTTTRIACGPNQTLQGNYTMRLMHDFGIGDND